MPLRGVVRHAVLLPRDKQIQADLYRCVLPARMPNLHIVGLGVLVFSVAFVYLAVHSGIATLRRFLLVLLQILVRRLVLIVTIQRRQRA